MTKPTPLYRTQEQVLYDLSQALHALDDPAYDVLDWNEVKRALRDKDQGKRR